MKSESHAELDKSSIRLDRELSQLAVKRRVMANPRTASFPYSSACATCIVSDNLDEFFEVRVASLLINQQYGIFNTEVLPQLGAEGVRLVRQPTSATCSPDAT